MPLTLEDRRKGGLKSAERWRGPKFKIPKGVDPIVRFLFEEMHRQQCTDDAMTKRVGMSTNSIGKWRKDGQPRVGNLQACLNVLGYELTVRRKKDDEP